MTLISFAWETLRFLLSNSIVRAGLSSKIRSAFVLCSTLDLIVFVAASTLSDIRKHTSNLVFALVGYWYVHCRGAPVDCGAVWKKHQRARSFVLVGNCDRSAHSIRVTAWQLCRLVVLVIVTCFRCPSLLGQMPPFGSVQVVHNSWSFNEGAPTDIQCLAQTSDGFLWLGGPNGLFRFDGTRFEPFTSPFGDRLFATNLYSLFAPPSGGLCLPNESWLR